VPCAVVTLSPTIVCPANLSSAVSILVVRVQQQFGALPGGTDARRFNIESLAGNLADRHFVFDLEIDANALLPGINLINGPPALA